jgi:hypothetical protein
MVWGQQPNVLRGIGNRAQTIGRGSGSGGGQDSLRNRASLEDSISLHFYFLDSTRSAVFDTSVREFTRYYPIPHTHIYLGNTGSATRSILFAPPRRVGFDPGFHAFDVYKLRVEDARFFNTTRPYTELNYLLGSRVEQNIGVLHTQNFKPYWNMSLLYRLFNAPGTFKNQKSNHNNYMITSWYQSPNKRYNNYGVVLNNKLQIEENGGVNIGLLQEPDYARDRYLIPTKMGAQAAFSPNPFSTNLITGNLYKEFNAFLRQQYDLGRKDSIVTDSTVIPLFYPRLRFEHTVKYGKYDYEFRDYTPDTSFYDAYYDTLVSRPVDTLVLRDRWKEISNDVSIYQFPDAKNLHQFIKIGAEFQFLQANFGTRENNIHNLIGHAEYRNRTRNGKWDMMGQGRLYLNGYNAGDYHGYVSLQRFLSQRLGSLLAGFENINRSPSFIYDARSNFHLDKGGSFSKENTVHFFGRIMNDRLRVNLGADYYLISNYLYVSDYFRLRQENALFNVLRLSAQKTFRLLKHINWHAEVYLQQKTGNVDVNMPLLFTRNRIAYEGNFGFPNLNFAGGFEVRYHTPYKADNYSPVLGQFFFQDTATISNLPDIHAYIHFRIKSFKGFIRAENLNTARVLDGTFGFTNNNLAAPDYPTPSLYIRFGISWSFIN